MKVSYTVQVCNESRELFSLVNFLLKVKDDEDDVIIIVDSLHKTDKVSRVIDHFNDRVSVYERPFDNFVDNSNFHIEKATGEYIFGLDSDEMPQETLIKNFKNVITSTDADVIWVPRINIHPGGTQEFFQKYNFNVNENGWINWPDYQGRIYKKNDKIKWGYDAIHTKLIGAEKSVQIQPSPQVALWHIKSIEKQDSRWENGDIRAPSTTSLYDLLM
jgi:hypothetical protein